MSISYQAKDEKFLNQQLKVQEVCIRFADVGLYTASTNDVIVDFNETLDSVFSVLHCDNSVPGAALITAANTVVSGEQVTITLAAPFAANDSLIIKYIVA